MPDKPLEQACDARVCIHTDQILDSCMDKDCVEDLRVYLTRESQAALDRSTGAKTRCAELLFARVEVEPLAYKRGHYAVERPPAIAEALGEELVLTGGTRRLYVTVGQFSTVRLERGAQLAVQSGGYCMPTRECCDDEGCEEDPCELFSRVDFPVRAFYPEGSDCGGTSCCGSCGK